MKNKTTLKLVLSTLLIVTGFVGTNGYSQSITNSSETTEASVYDARLLNHYSAEELDQMKVEFPEKLSAAQYYYTQSYTLQIVDCFECTPIDPALFDVSNYENLRKIDEIRIFDNPKLGFILTLTPINALAYKLPIHLAKLEYND